MPDTCCTTCFGDPWLQDYVRERSKESGVCEFCGAANSPLIEITHLYEPLSNLLDMYAEAQQAVNIPLMADVWDYGEPLVDLLQEDWSLFSEPLWESGNAPKLIDTVMNKDYDPWDPPGFPPLDANELYCRDKSLDTLKDAWERFRDDVAKDKGAEHGLNYLKRGHIKDAEQVLTPDHTLYRARRGFNSDADGRDTPYRGVQIGAPPQEKAKAGRANKEGSAVFYAADQEKTAVAEIRPYRGMVASICTAHPINELTIIDLSRPIETPNPFVTKDLGLLLEVRQLLNTFAEDLSIPLKREDDKEDYLPSQAISELIEKLGYAGIRYPSAMSDGTNIVLFNPSQIEIGDSKLVKVVEVNLKYRAYQK